MKKNQYGRKRKKNEEEKYGLDLKTMEGKLLLAFIILFIIVYILLLSQNTASFFDWYPGKALDELRSR